MKRREISPNASRNDEKRFRSNCSSHHQQQQQQFQFQQPQIHFQQQQFFQQQRFFQQQHPFFQQQQPFFQHGNAKSKWLGFRHSGPFQNYRQHQQQQYNQNDFGIPFQQNQLNQGNFQSHDSRKSHHDSYETHRNSSEACHNLSEYRSDYRETHHDSRETHRNSRETHCDSRETRHNSSGYHHNSHEADHNLGESHHNSSESHHNSRNSHYDSRESHHNSRNSHYDSRETRHFSQKSNHDSRDTHHFSQKSNHDSIDTHHNSNESHQNARESHDSQDYNRDDNFGGFQSDFSGKLTRKPNSREFPPPSTATSSSSSPPSPPGRGFIGLPKTILFDSEEDEKLQNSQQLREEQQKRLQWMQENKEITIIQDCRQLKDDLVSSQDRILLLRTIGLFTSHASNSNLNSSGDDFSRDVWKFFQRSCQSLQDFEQKIQLWLELDRVIGSRFQGSRVMAFGSTLSGFGSRSSDMDLCIFSDHIGNSVPLKGQPNKNSNKAEVTFLTNVRRELKRKCKSFISNDIELIPAKVPILKFFDHHGGLEVDLSCNSKVGARNTHLLFCYSKLDWRVRPLVLAIKTWSSNWKINEAKEGTLSSYALTLLVLNFLQCGVRGVPVLPCLQHKYPEIFHSNSDIYTLPYLKELPDFKSDNSDSIGDLFRQFFSYYVNRFDFSRDVASVRLGSRLTIRDCEKFAREQKIGPGQWSAHICVEEPFDRTNAGRAVIHRERFEDILEALSKTKAMLEKGSVTFDRVMLNN